MWLKAIENGFKKTRFWRFNNLEKNFKNPDFKFLSFLESPEDPQKSRFYTRSHSTKFAVMPIIAFQSN